MKSDVGLCCLLFGNLAYIIYNENQLVGLNIIFSNTVGSAVHDLCT